MSAYRYKISAVIRKPHHVIRVTWVIGISLVFGIAAIGTAAYFTSRQVLLDTIYQDNLRLAKGYRDIITYDTQHLGSDKKSIRAHIKQLWLNSPEQYPGSYLCLVDRDGNLTAHTLAPENEGTYVGDNPISQLLPGDPTTLLGLIHAKIDWVGPYRSSSGQRQIAAFSYSAAIDSVIAVHVPVDAVNMAIRTASLPWIIGITILGALFLPGTIVFLYRAYSTSQDELTLANQSLHESNKRLAELAMYDSLTMINNRSSFTELLRNAMARTRRSKQRLAIMFVDLDGFKTVNDNFGHSVGDEILIAVANRLSARIRQSDILARWGGDEFTIILENVNRETAATLAQELLTEISKQFIVDGNSIYLTASIGISIYSGNASNSETLLKNADTAMYYAKKKLGQNTLAFYTHELGEKTSKRSKHLINLRQALEKKEFQIEYQPKINLDDGRTTGFEALLQWRPLDDEPVNPVDFIPLLETSGLIAPVGEWVLRKSCTDIKSRQLTQKTPLILSVNISAQQFNQNNFLDMVTQILTDTNFDSKYLQFEIAESVFLQTKPNWLQSVKKLGVSLCLDDFGSGYSSLSYLRRYPLDYLKLNHSFIKDVGVDSGCSAIVVSTIELAHNLNIRVIANGVENKQQVEFLRKHHCDEIQGFLISQSLDISELDEWQNSKDNSAMLQL